LVRDNARRVQVQEHQLCLCTRMRHARARARACAETLSGLSSLTSQDYSRNCAGLMAIRAEITKRFGNRSSSDNDTQFSVSGDKTDRVVVVVIKHARVREEWSQERREGETRSWRSWRRHHVGDSERNAPFSGEQRPILYFSRLFSTFQYVNRSRKEDSRDSSGRRSSKR